MISRAKRLVHRDVFLVLKGQERIRCWLSSVGSDFIVCYPRPVSLAVANARLRGYGRSVFRFSQLMDILDAPPAFLTEAK